MTDITYADLYAAAKNFVPGGDPEIWHRMAHDAINSGELASFNTLRQMAEREKKAHPAPVISFERGR